MSTKPEMDNDATGDEMKGALLPLPTRKRVRQRDEIELENEQSEQSVEGTQSGNEPGLSAEFLVIAHGVISHTVRGVWWAFRAFVGYFKHHPIHAALNGVFITLLGLLVVTGSEVYDDVTLSQISERTVDQIVEASKYTRDYSAVKVQSRGSIELLNVGAPKWTQREAIRAVLFHARKAGLSLEDQAVLLATVEVESGFNPMARAPTTTACGLFQFVKKTGEIFGLKQEDCMNPWLNAYAGVKHYLSNYQNRVADQVTDLQGAERVFRTFELSYYLHHDGPQSSNPSNDVKAVVISGTQFLFRVLHVLENEAASKQEAPSFAERFTQNVWKLLDSVKAMFVSGSTVMAEQPPIPRDS